MLLSRSVLAYIRSAIHEAGFVDIQIHIETETSSRRKDQAAYFYYCQCRKPAATT